MTLISRDTHIKTIKDSTPNDKIAVADTYRNNCYPGLTHRAFKFLLKQPDQCQDLCRHEISRRRNFGR